jgi:excisionase family DNA binding protein
MLTVDEVAKYLRVSRATVCRWCGSGKLPAFKIGKGWRVQRRDLENYIHQQRLGVAITSGADYTSGNTPL